MLGLGQVSIGCVSNFETRDFLYFYFLVCSQLSPSSSSSSNKNRYISIIIIGRRERGNEAKAETKVILPFNIEIHSWHKTDREVNKSSISSAFCLSARLLPDCFLVKIGKKDFASSSPQLKCL